MSHLCFHVCNFTIQDKRRPPLSFKPVSAELTVLLWLHDAFSNKLPRSMFHWSNCTVSGTGYYNWNGGIKALWNLRCLVWVHLWPWQCVSTLRGITSTGERGTERTGLGKADTSRTSVSKKNKRYSKMGWRPLKHVSGLCMYVHYVAAGVWSICSSHNAIALSTGTAATFTIQQINKCIQALYGALISISELPVMILLHACNTEHHCCVFLGSGTALDLAGTFAS